jgi:hypothetical protein
MKRKIVAAALAGAGLVAGGQKLTKESPVHFMAEGSPPEAATDWACAPEGGIVGAPVVCRYVGTDLGGVKKAVGADAALGPAGPVGGLGDSTRTEAR